MVVARWMRSDLAPGIVLLVATAGALVWVNSPLGDGYTALWHTKLGWDSLGLRLEARHWVNDALMTVFFVIGLEIKHELVAGQLAHPRQAAVPALAAVGGAVVPAAVFLALTQGGLAAAGWGVPMATDPAFAVGILALVARRVPAAVRVLLLAIATVDDVLAVAVIAVGYPGGVTVGWLAAAAGGCVLLVLMRRLGVTAVWPYLPVALAVWYSTLQSGVHATVAAVTLALLTPAGEVGGRPVLRRMLDVLAPVSAFVAVPVFALANAGVRLDPASIIAAGRSRVTLAVLAGLLIGKFVGIVGTIGLTTAIGLGRLPDGVSRRHVAGLGLIAGLGFTVALFITELAYTDPVLIEHAKIGVLAASAIAAASAAAVLATARTGSRQP